MATVVHAAQAGGDPAGDLGAAFVHVGDDPLPFPGQAAPHHARPRGDGVGSDHVGHAGRPDDDVGPAGVVGPVLHPRVNYRHRGIGARLLQREQQGQGTPERRSPADDYHRPALQRDPVVLQHDLDAQRGAWPRMAALAEGEITEVHRV
jgi:hypothetical protein